MYSRLPPDHLAALLAHSPRRRARSGEWLSDPEAGLRDPLVLLAGELEVRRSWTGADGEIRTQAWRLAPNADGPGFSLLGAGGGTQVRALTDADFIVIPGDELDQMLGWSHLGGNRLPLRHLKVFHEVPLENIQQAFERMVERPVAEGETIVTQGEPGDSYYIILSGQAEVWVTDPLTDETTRAAVLCDADAFGEEALLLEGSRTATVKMISPGRLLALAKGDFDELLKPRMVAEVDAAAAHEMLQRGQAKLLDCRYEMEYDESHIPGALLVPLDRLRREGVFALDPEPLHIVYCRSGRRSKAAAFLLRERGIRALSLRGGIQNWPYELAGATA